MVAIFEYIAHMQTHVESENCTLKEVRLGADAWEGLTSRILVNSIGGMPPLTRSGTFLGISVVCDKDIPANSLVFITREIR